MVDNVYSYVYVCIYMLVLGECIEVYFELLLSYGWYDLMIIVIMLCGGDDKVVCCFVGYVEMGWLSYSDLGLVKYMV